MTQERARALRLVVIAYVVAIAAGGLTLLIAPGGPIMQAFIADVVATVVIFIYSRVYKNSSFYDPYWSVIPPLLAVYWMLAAGSVDARGWLAFALVCFWAVRLTANWTTHWGGLHHEDWRYPMVRDSHPNFALLLDFAGIHLFPTVQVFLGCLPLYAAITLGGDLIWLDYVAAAVMFTAVMIELIADLQLHAFIKNRKPGEFIRTGLWAWSRHPNYFGEVLFWWGLMLFGLAAYPEGWWWLILGALAMTLMFVVVSIPMMDKRSCERRPGYDAFMRQVPMLVPQPPK